MTPSLMAKGIEVTYGGHRAVAGVDVSLAAGTITGLIGPNGAGKTSFIDALTGFVEYAGTIELSGASLDHLTPADRARRGLRRTFQDAELFNDLTVRENLEVAATPCRWWDPLRDLLGRRDLGTGNVMATLELLGLESVANEPCLVLSHGQQRLVGLGRALVAQPSVLVLDEPAAGLDSMETAALAGHVEAIRDGGMAVLLVDHDMDLVMAISDTLTVMDFGEIIATGDAEAVRRDQRVITAYLGDVGATEPSSQR